jgi:hypothetical protein
VVGGKAVTGVRDLIKSKESVGVRRDDFYLGVSANSNNRYFHLFHFHQTTFDFVTFDDLLLESISLSFSSCQRTIHSSLIDL